MIFKKTHDANRGTRTYKSDEGLVVYVPKSAGEQPETFSAEGLNVPAARAAKEAKAKMSPEDRKAAAAERKAKNAGLTPAQKIEAEEKRIEARRAQIEARKAKLAAAGNDASAAM